MGRYIMYGITLPAGSPTASNLSSPALATLQRIQFSNEGTQELPARVAMQSQRRHDHIGANTARPTGP